MTTKEIAVQEPEVEAEFVDDTDEAVEGEVVLGSIVRSDEIKDMLQELAEARESGEAIKPAKGVTKAKALALNDQIAAACGEYGKSFDEWVRAGEHVVTLIEEGLLNRTFAALKFSDPIEWIKSVVDFPMVDPNARKLLSKTLFQLGLSVRGIAEITGKSKSTASNDLKDVSKAGHVTKGKDGKEYTSTEDEEPEEDSAEWEEGEEGGEDEADEEPAAPVNVLTAAKEATEALTEWTDELVSLSENDKFTKSAKTIHKRYADTLTTIYENLGTVIDKLTSAVEEL